jgi:hypothetical protein
MEAQSLLFSDIRRAVAAGRIGTDMAGKAAMHCLAAVLQGF